MGKYFVLVDEVEETAAEGSVLTLKEQLALIVGVNVVSFLIGCI